MISSNTTTSGVGLRPASTTARAPPTIPPRNGSKLETVASPPKKYFDSNIEEHAPASPKTPAVTAAKNDEVDADKKVGNGGSKVLKSRNEAQNSFVFNFVNTKKDTSHLEYDGLDLSNRTKKVRFLIFSKPINIRRIRTGSQPH